MKPVQLIWPALFVLLLAAPLRAQKRDLALMEQQVAAWISKPQKAPTDTVGSALVNDLIVMYIMRNQELKALNIAQSAVTIGEQMLTKCSGVDQRNVRAKFCNSYTMLCMLLRSQMAYDQAAEVAHRLLNQAKISGNNSSISSAYGQLARSHEKLGDEASALPLRWAELGYAKKASGIDQAECHLRLGQVHFSLGDLDSAVYHFQKGLVVNDQAQAPQKNVAILCELVKLYAGLADDERMEQYSTQLVALGNSVPQKRYQRRIHEGRATVYFMRSRYTETIAEMRKAQSLEVDGVDQTWQWAMHQLFALAYAAEHKNQTALLHMDSALVAHKNSLGLDKVRALAKMQADKEHERELQVAQAQVQVERSRKWLLVVITVSIFALGILGWLLFRATRIRARLLAQKNEQILSAQAQLVHSEKQREAEQVRTRISRDIHDNIGGELTKVVLLGTELMCRIDKGQSAVLAIVDRIQAQARAASSAISDVVWAADPEQDTVSSLMDHVERHALHLFEGSAITLRCDLERPGANRDISPLVKHNIFMVLKETLNNVLKYAQASEVEVSLHAEGTDYTLKVKDNGIGFQADEQASQGNGTRYMRSRAQQIGAHLELHSVPGTGTSIVLHGTLDHPSR